MEIKNEELLEECLYIYDDDLDALSFHIFTIYKLNNKRLSQQYIKEQLLNKTKLDKYRDSFIKVMDSFKSEIDKYKAITKLNFTYSIANLCFAMENSNYINTLSKKEKNKIKKDIVEIINLSEQTLNKLKD